jgi:hypothetical protein
MKKVALSLVLVAGLATSAMAADIATKAPTAPPALPPSPWDVRITAALMTDYNDRGITLSAHKPSALAGFELRYTQSPMWQYYAAISGQSIVLPNQAAAQINFIGGVRPTFDKLGFDFGVWYKDFVGGQCFNGDLNTPCNPPGNLPNGNAIKGNVSYIEGFAKATYTFNDQWATSIQESYAPSVGNSGAFGWYTAGNITFTAPSSWFQGGLGMYVSGDLAYWALGTTDNFSCTVDPATNACGLAFPGGIPLTSYWNWDAGLGFTYKAFTLDLRYYATNLTKAECNAFTGDQTATFNPGSVTAQNPGGLASNWCGGAFIAQLSFATNLSNIK